MKNIVPIVIPCFEPDDRIIGFMEKLVKLKMPIVVIDDGSGEKKKYLFDKVNEIVVKSGGEYHFISYEINMGKGYALKEGFKYVINNFRDAIGVVSADCDGQHDVDDIKKVIDELVKSDCNLILGCRNFDLDEIPSKSKLGNKLTKFVFNWLLNIKISDTQTGLRGIRANVLANLLKIKANRFEFETEMIVYCKNSILEVGIKTIYESVENHITHFRAVRDSIMIYLVILRQFFKYIISSVSSFVVDIFLFYVLCYLFKNFNFLWPVMFATYLARVGSAIFNYFVNKIFVFDKSNSCHAFVKYAGLCFGIATLSGILVTLIYPYFNNIIWVKVCVDAVLFIISYVIQQRYVFR